MQNIDEAGTMVNETKLTGSQEAILKPGDVITVVERSFRYENPHFARLFPTFGHCASPAKTAALPSTPVKGTPLREEVKAALDGIVPESAKLTPRRLQAQAATPVTSETFCVTPTKNAPEAKQAEATVGSFKVTPLKEAAVVEMTPKAAAAPATPMMPSKLGQSPINTLLGSASSAATPRLSSLSMVGTPRTPRATIPGSPTVVDHEIVASPKFSKGEVYEYPAALTEDASVCQDEIVACEPIVEANTEAMPANNVCKGAEPVESLIDAQEPMAEIPIEPTVTEVESPAAEPVAEQMTEAATEKMEETLEKMEQVEERMEAVVEKLEEANVVSTEPAAESAEMEQQPIVTLPEETAAPADPMDDVQMFEAAPLEEVQEQKMEVVEEEKVETLLPVQQEEVAPMVEATPEAVMEEPQAVTEEAVPNVEMTETGPLVEEAPAAPEAAEVMAVEKPEESTLAPEEAPELVPVADQPVAHEAAEEVEQKEEVPTEQPMEQPAVEEPAVPEASTLAAADQSQEAPSMATEPTQEDLEAIAAIQAEESATPRRSSRRASAAHSSPAAKGTPSKRASSTATPVKAKATPLSKSTSAANMSGTLEETGTGEERYVLAPAEPVEAPTTASKRGRRASVARTPAASSAKKTSTRSTTRRGAAAKAEAEPESSASPSKNSHLAKTTSMSDTENDENQNINLALPNDNEVDVTKAVAKKRGRPPTVHAATSPATKNVRSS